MTAPPGKRSRKKSQPQRLPGGPWTHAAGCDAYEAKPIDWPQFMQRVQALLLRPPAEEGALA